MACALMYMTILNLATGRKITLENVRCPNLENPMLAKNTE